VLINFGKTPILNFFKNTLTSSQVAVQGETSTRHGEAHTHISANFQSPRMEEKNWFLHSSRKIWNLVYLKGSADKINGIYKSQ